jgi:hypothetical protein
MEFSLSPQADVADAAAMEARGRELSAAVAAFKRDGFVVLQDVVDADGLDLLAGRMLADVDTIMRQEPPPYQFVNGHIQHDPPPMRPYLLRDLYYNEAVIEVARQVLGDGLKMVGVTGNTNMPGSLQQPLHVDSGHLWRGLQEPHPTCQLVVNIAPQDVGPDNGATQLWPGSHLDDAVFRQDASIVVSAVQEQTRRQIAAPIQLSLPRGSVLIRDMRLWHRGMPNKSQTPRPMVALIMASAWMHGAKLKVQAGSEGFFCHEKLDIPVEAVEGPLNYLHRHSPYDYQP